MFNMMMISNTFDDSQCSTSVCSKKNRAKKHLRLRRKLRHKTTDAYNDAHAKGIKNTDMKIEEKPKATWYESV